MCFEEQVTDSDRRMQFHTGIPSIVLFKLEYIIVDKV